LRIAPGFAEWPAGDMGGLRMMTMVGLLEGYLLGSIPFGLLLGIIAGVGDIRTIGSGNIGATNVLRTGRKGIAALTLLLDGTKGYVAVTVMDFLVPDGIEPLLAAALGAVVGHCFPVWLRFRGGKGVATLLGAVLALDPQAGLIYAGVWLAALALTRISSIGGISAAISAPASMWFLGGHGKRTLVTTALMAALVVIQHRANIGRLLAGTEPRVGRRSPPAGA
jgi:glycerol-3-phosphate acyltransferase PlsY